MEKREILLQLSRAKAAHIQWRAYAQALISGIPVEDNHVPMIHTDCKFGKWYYGQGQRLSFLSLYVAIETPHEILHKIYMKIFKLLFGEDNRTTLQKIFGSTAKLEQKKQEEAELLLEKLLSVSGTLLETIGLLENEVKDMSEEALSSL